jgi:ABC-type transport system involved in multi-copper enzyme maturation permease subunit
MATTAVARSEWVKIRTLRSTIGSLVAVFVVTVGLSALVCALRNKSKPAAPDFDPLAFSFYGLTFGQVAAISFGALVVSQEFHNAAVRVSLCAVPRRGVFYAGKMAVIGGLTLVIGVLTTLVTLVLGKSMLGEFGHWSTADLRAVVGGGIYLALMALLAAGLTALLRSGLAVLSVLIPFLLIFPFVFNDVGSGIITYLPDQAGQLIVQQDPQGQIGPWVSLGVTALWAAATLLAGWFAFNRRDA